MNTTVTQIEVQTMNNIMTQIGSLIIQANS